MFRARSAGPQPVQVSTSRAEELRAALVSALENLKKCRGRPQWVKNNARLADEFIEIVKKESQAGKFEAALRFIAFHAPHLAPEISKVIDLSGTEESINTAVLSYVQ